MDIENIKRLCSRIRLKCLGMIFNLQVHRDQKNPEGRVYLQIDYTTPCVKTGGEVTFKGRKFYLSDHMLDDEIVKTAYLAFKLAVEHEVMEGFSVDGKIVFNPHVSYSTLLEVSDKEVKRS